MLPHVESRMNFCPQKIVNATLCRTQSNCSTRDCCNTEINKCIVDTAESNECCTGNGNSNRSRSDSLRSDRVLDSEFFTVVVVPFFVVSWTRN